MPKELTAVLFVILAWSECGVKVALGVGGTCRAFATGSEAITGDLLITLALFTR